MYEPNLPTDAVQELPTTTTPDAGEATADTPGSLSAAAPASGATTRDKWLGWRMGHIGGSEISAIMGLSKYQTPLDIQRDKLGLAPPQSQTPEMILGRELEVHVGNKYAEMEGVEFTRAYAEARKHPDTLFVGGSADGHIIDGAGVMLLAEIKTTSVWNYRHVKRNGIPAHWLMQLQYYLEIYNFNRGIFLVAERSYEYPKGHGLDDSTTFDLVSMARNYGPLMVGEILAVEVEQDRDLGSTMVAYAHEWYERHVINGEPVCGDIPPPQIRLSQVGGEVEHIDSGAWRDAVAAYLTARDLSDQAAQLLDEAKAGLTHAMGDRDAVEGCGIRVYHREQAGRRTLDQKALAAANPDINLDAFMKTGKPFKSLKITEINAGGE